MRVTGIHNKELLSIVSNEVDLINEAFERIQVNKKIPCICEECLVDPEPHFFRLETLDRYLSKGRYDITCEKSCLDVPVRQLTAVLGEPDFVRRDPDRAYDKSTRQIRQERIEQQKNQHTEFFQPGPNIVPSTVINAENVIIGGQENTITQPQQDPNAAVLIRTLVTLLTDIHQKYPALSEDNVDDIIDAEIANIQQDEPNRWQSLRQQVRDCPTTYATQNG